MLMLTFSACGDNLERTVYTDINDYNDIWTLSDRRIPGYKHDAYGISVLFPQSVSELEVLDFYCLHDNHLIGASYQIWLSVKYDDEPIDDYDFDQFEAISHRNDGEWLNCTALLQMYSKPGNYVPRLVII